MVKERKLETNIVGKNQMETLDTKGSGGKGTLDTNPGGGKRKNLDENTKICVEQKPKNKGKVCINDTHENKNTDNKDPTGPGYKNKNKNVKDNYLEPKRKPTAIEKRRLFGKALEILLVTALKNHVYQFGNEIRVQKRGGPIGLKLTGEIADCIMIEWDRILMKELKKLNIEPMVYTRFKDDI
jgi:hypothetical protein